MTGEIVYGEAAETGSYGSKTVAVDIGKIVGGIVDGCEIVAHALSCPVAADCLVPLMAEAGQTAAVWCHDYVAVGCHDLEVPAVAPELAYRALRAAFAEEQGGVFLVWVEIGRENDPCEHVLAVGGLHPTLLYLAERKLGEDVVVFAGNLCYHGFLHILARGDDVDVGGRGEALACGEQLLAVVGEGYAAVVCLVVGNLTNGAFQVYLIHIDASVPYADEREGLGVGVPAECVDVGVERGADIVFLACGEVVDAKAVEVCLVAVASHRLPCHIASVGRELWVLVVARIVFEVFRSVHRLVFQCVCSNHFWSLVVGRLAEVACLARTYII